MSFFHLGERYVYKFVCDPEALLTLGLAGSDGTRRGSHDPGIGGSVPQQQDRRSGLRVLPHSYYSHHRSAASYAGKNFHKIFIFHITIQRKKLSKY